MSLLTVTHEKDTPVRYLPGPDGEPRPYWEFCAWTGCRHHAFSHDYTVRASDPRVACTECPGGTCTR